MSVSNLRFFPSAFYIHNYVLFLYSTLNNNSTKNKNKQITFVFLNSDLLFFYFFIKLCLKTGVWVQAMTLTVSGNTSSSTSSFRSMDKIVSSAAAAPPVDTLPTSEQCLLAKLEAANKLIESDAKSLNSLQSSAHSRKSSDTSQISVNSGKSWILMLQMSYN